MYTLAKIATLIGLARLGCAIPADLDKRAATTYVDTVRPRLHRLSLDT